MMTNQEIDALLVYLGIDPDEPIRIGLDGLPLLPSEYGGDNDPQAAHEVC